MNDAATRAEESIAAAPPRAPALVLALGVLLVLALITEVPYVNGPEYSRWLYRTLPFDKAFALFAGPLVLYAYLLRRAVLAMRAGFRKQDARFIVAGLVACTMLLQYASLHVDKRGRTLLAQSVQDPGVTGYYSNATEITDARAFLDGFASAKLHTHSKTHPSGPILYYYGLTRAFGPEHAAWIGGMLIGILASFGVAMVYVLAGLWATAGSARVMPSFVFALSPALIGFLPEFDQVYPILAMAMIVTWSRALARPLAGAWLGLALFLASLMAYNLIATGAFMAPYTLWWLHERRWQRQDIARALLAAAVALGTFVAAHLLLWAAGSYHALDSLRSSLSAQAHFSRHNRRPYGSVIWTDPFDFFLGGGLITLPLMLLHLRRPRESALTWLALLAIVTVDLTGLLRCETARVWLFLQPLAVVPAGLELARWEPHTRALTLGLFALILIVVRCKLRFVL